jgi:hypothetical protein
VFSQFQNITQPATRLFVFSAISHYLANMLVKLSEVPCSPAKLMLERRRQKQQVPCVLQNRLTPAKSHRGFVYYKILINQRCDQLETKFGDTFFYLQLALKLMQKT